MKCYNGVVTRSMGYMVNGFENQQDKLDIGNHKLAKNQSLVIKRGREEYATRLVLKQNSKIEVEEGAALYVGFSKSGGKDLAVDKSFESKISRHAKIIVKGKMHFANQDLSEYVKCENGGSLTQGYLLSCQNLNDNNDYQCETTGGGG